MEYRGLDVHIKEAYIFSQKNDTFYIGEYNIIVVGQGDV